ncbi:tRNA lysidine(34) synthetase TilS [Alkalihalobacillus deserti]|uniref:tRNA lysidine(34) synthetase TilS n=1 Tax=Alkalihalobacillus deserti TaxID=2879466 RepID=UPI001D15C930|nr:tRNA lysidine(34) synthetase TilS [Alkalihalobacillus deserti]
MKADVHNFIQNHQLIEKGDTLFVAVSGGPDSMALLHYLWSRKDLDQIELVACHVHHQLRGEEADTDATYVKQFCLDHKIQFLEKRVDVKGYAKDKNIGTQFAARELRYLWFAELLQCSNNKLVTGHHGDDQIETMLMKMVRGTVPLHTFGIPAKRKLGNGFIIRPFLGITKEKIEQYCREASISPRQDLSNYSSTYTRNRFRKEVLPFLKKENPNIHLHMQRQNEWASDDHDYLMAEAENKIPAIIIRKSERNVTISRITFLRIGVALQRRVIHLILSYLYGKNSPFITSIHIEQVLNVLQRQKTTAELHLSNTLLVRREYDLCHFSLGLMNRMEEQAQILTIPGRIKLARWEIDTYVTENVHLVESRHQIVLDYKKIVEPLLVRFKQPQDRMACRGMEGTKKIGRLFIDRKISKQERESWPLLVDSKGEVLWVPFLHRSKLANIDHRTEKVLVISCERRDG